MQGVFERKYGVETTIDFTLFETDGVDFKTDAAHAAGDSIIMKDEGAEANTTNGFVDEGNGYSITLTAAEMQAARITVYLIDQSSPKVWLDTSLVVETYGNAAAQHAFDRDQATPDVNVAEISDDSTAADNLETYCDGGAYMPVNAAQVEGADATDTIGDSVLDEVFEGAYTLRQLCRGIMAVLLNESAGGGTGTVTFRDAGDTKNRVTATVDANDNRTGMVIDLT